MMPGTCFIAEMARRGRPGLVVAFLAETYWYHVAPKFKDLLGINMNTQRVLKFPDRVVCTRYRVLKSMVCRRAPRSEHFVTIQGKTPLYNKTAVDSGTTYRLGEATTFFLSRGYIYIYIDTALVAARSKHHIHTQLAKYEFRRNSPSHR